MTSSKKFALVTGGSRSIGAAICRNLHNAGIDIMILFIDLCSIYIGVYRRIVGTVGSP